MDTGKERSRPRCSSKRPGHTHTKHTNTPHTQREKEHTMKTKKNEGTSQEKEDRKDIHTAKEVSTHKHTPRVLRSFCQPRASPRADTHPDPRICSHIKVFNDTEYTYAYTVHT